MSEVEPIELTSILTRAEADAIASLRPLLKQAARRVSDAAITSESAGEDPMWRVRMDAMRCGQLVASLDVAEDALFEVLNYAANYTDCDEARRVLHGEGQEL